MNQSGFVTTNENCGFFDIHSAESFEIVNPGRQVGRILGLKDKTPRQVHPSPSAAARRKRRHRFPDLRL